MVIDAREAKVLEGPGPQGLDQSGSRAVSTSSSPRATLFEQLLQLRLFDVIGTRQ